MMKYYLKDLKKVLFSQTHLYFKEKGFKFQQKKPVAYNFLFNSGKITLVFIFRTLSNSHENIPIKITFNEVEKLINKIGKPDSDPENKELWYTLHDNFSDNYTKQFKKLELTTPEAFEQWGHLIIDYMETQGNAFIEKYSCLPNVLKELDRLENEAEKSYLKILVGGIDHIFRALIISKLCNDPDYFRKQNKWEKAIMIEKYAKWHPYYNKLKEELATLEPIYNIES